MSDKPLYVTEPALPPFEQFEPLLRQIWASRRLTNGGEFSTRLETELAAYLEAPRVSLLANGTLALMLALKALEVEGEVITTPYSFVATTHALLWSGCTPVFADIDPASLNLDPAAVEAAITPRTRAILAVHVYGRPCDTAGLQAVADRHGLRLIYDAAHAFGVRLGTGSLMAAGDLSILSFHATKVFHTFEGGAIVCRDEALKARIDLLRNFGFKGETRVLATGINAKMNEFQAAFGCLALAGIDQEIAARAAIAARYRQAFAPLAGLRLLPAQPGVRRHNHGYFPVFIEAGFPLARDALYTRLREQGIIARRYFHPLISDFDMYRDAPGADHLPVARRMADTVLCLPLFGAMDDADVARVIDAVSAAART